MKTLFVVFAIWLMVFVAVLSAFSYRIERRLNRRKALRVLGHAKHMLWDRAWRDESDNDALTIIQSALMAVYSE